MMKIVKIVDFRRNSGNSGRVGAGDGVLNFNHRGTGRGKTAGDLGERLPRVPRGIPKWKRPNSLFTDSILHAYIPKYLLR